MQLVVDDGVPDRGHRVNLFKPDFMVTGNFSGPHSQYNTMTCSTFASQFAKKGEQLEPSVSGGATAGGGSTDAQIQAWMKEDVPFDMPAG